MVDFGVKTGPGGYTFEDLKSIWFEAEKLGFNSGWLYDHLYSLSGKDDACLECWTTLASLASLTKRLKVGTMVLCNQFRHPSLLAKMGATLDLISNGRLEFGIGAGWYDEESRECGIDFPDAKTRILRLREAVQVIRMLWTSEKASFTGAYYTLNGAICKPKPVQKPHPPIWIGTGKGTKLMPKVVAEVADGVNISFKSPEECQRRIDLLQAACSKIGRPLKQIRLSLQCRILIAEDDRRLKERIESLARKAGTDAATYVKQQESEEAALIGPPSRIIEGLQKYVDLGIDYFMIIFLGDTTLEPLRIFADSVMPEFH